MAVKKKTLNSIKLVIHLPNQGSHIFILNRLIQLITENTPSKAWILFKNWILKTLYNLHSSTNDWRYFCFYYRLVSNEDMLGYVIEFFSPVKANFRIGTYVSPCQVGHFCRFRTVFINVQTISLCINQIIVFRHCCIDLSPNSLLPSFFRKSTFFSSYIT